MNTEQQKNEQYPYYNHDSKVWTRRLIFFGKSLAGVLVILIGCSQIPKGSEDQFWNVFILGSVTWLILLTAWEQIGVTEKQWQVMQDGLTKTQDLIEQSERHFRATERPLLYVDEVFGRVRPYLQLQPTVQISNRGRGHAVDIQLWIAFSPGPNHTFEPEITYGVHIDALAPGANPLDLSVKLDSDDWMITKEIFAEITDPNKARFIYIYYGGSYFDIDKRTQYTLEQTAWRWDRDKGFMKDAFMFSLIRDLRERRAVKQEKKGNQAN